MKGFIPHIYRDGQPKGWKYMEASAIGDCQIGLALKVTSGKLAKAGSTDVPAYIAMYKGTVAAGDVIPVMPVDGSVEFETELSVQNTSIAVGAKYTIDTTGMMITATTASGVAEVIEADGTAIGSRVLVRFDRAAVAQDAAAAKA